METVETPQPTPPVEQKSTDWTKIILAAIVGFGLLAGSAYAGYYYGTQEISKLKDQISNLRAELAGEAGQPKTQNQVTPTPTPEPTTPPVTEPTVNLKTYTNEMYGFSFDYPQNWNINDIQGQDSPGISLSNIANGHTISVTVWRVTGFGYCYKYSERKEIVVGGKIAGTSDGVGGTEMCSEPEKYLNRGNTFVLIPLDEGGEGLPLNQIHISYDYPLSDISIAKSNLDQILSTFKFIE